MEALADLIRSVERNSILIDDFKLTRDRLAGRTGKRKLKKSSGGS